MKKNLMCTLIFCTALFTAKAQDYLTRNGYIEFYSHTPLEDIKAQNNEVVSILNSTTGEMEFKVAIKGFHFPKTAMEEHFNGPDYMNSTKYPKAGFKGKITNVSTVDLSKNGTYKATVSGDLTIREVTKSITVTGTLTVNNGKVNIQSTFPVKRKDYNIIGESFVQKKIAEEIEITVKCEYEKR